jgi:LacI family transcriptional regulator
MTSNKKNFSGATLTDIAKEAGVSKATVSMALNGNKKIAPATAAKILKIAKERKYRPNAFAKGLSTGKSQIISLILLARLGDPAEWILQPSWMFYNPIFRGVTTVISRKKYQLQFEFINLSFQDYKTIIANTIREGRTDGMLLLVTNEFDHSFLMELTGYAVPIIILNKELTPDFNSVELNNYAGAYEAVSYLISLGHRKIAHIKGPEDSYNAQKNYHGYVNALRDNRIQIGDDYILTGDWKIESAKELMSKLLKLASPPTAVFCASDHMAIGAMQAITEAGLSVPRDISVIGCDDTEVSRVVTPKLTTIASPLEEFGRIAAETLMSDIESNGANTLSKKHILLTPVLLKRDSCAQIKDKI